MKYVKRKGGYLINDNESYEGEPLETKIKKMVESKEPIESISPEIFDERDEGVKAEHDIRTDPWDIAQNAMDYVSKTNIAKRKEAAKTEDNKATEDGASTQAANSVTD